MPASRTVVSAQLPLRPTQPTVVEDPEVAALQHSWSQSQGATAQLAARIRQLETDLAVVRKRRQRQLVRQAQLAAAQRRQAAPDLQPAQIVVYQSPAPHPASAARPTAPPAVHATTGASGARPVANGEDSGRDD
jgi:hypothetical protein